MLEVEKEFVDSKEERDHQGSLTIVLLFILCVLVELVLFQGFFILIKGWLVLVHCSWCYIVSFWIGVQNNKISLIVVFPFGVFHSKIGVVSFLCCIFCKVCSYTDSPPPLSVSRLTSRVLHS